MAAPPFKLKKSSHWSYEELSQFLADRTLPLRLGVNSASGPLIVPLWYRYNQHGFWCAVHKDAQLVSILEHNPTCAIDVSTNDIPYRGVRGAGVATLNADRGAAMLQELIQRYLGGENSSLARWLLSRSEDELALRVQPTWLTSWDYSGRMADVDPRH